MSVQSTARAVLALVLIGDAGLEQVIAGRLQLRRWQPVWFLLAESTGDQAEGVFGLPAGQQVRAVLPLGDHAEPPLLLPGQAGQRLVDAGEVGGPPAGLGQAHAGQQALTLSWRERTPIGSTASICGAMPEAPVISSSAASVIMTAGLLRAAETCKWLRHAVPSH
jgi:hypothetical protein